jgi:hypothetical protein
MEYAKGGPVEGNGDRVPVLLFPGEYYISRKVAQRWGRELLERLNCEGDFDG